MPVEPSGLDAATPHATARPPQPPPASHRRPRSRSAGLFRAFWRWHFYASFLVIPVVLVLAVTGLIYLFRFQLEPILYGDLVTVEEPSGAIAQPYAAQLTKVEAAYPDAEIVSVTEPRAADRSSVFSLSMPDGSTRDVYVDPFRNEVLGALNPDTTVAGTAVRLHADLMSGRLGDYVIEVAACWAIVMALTGYYLFVKGRAARRRRVKAGVRGARLRGRHGIVGAVVGVGLLMLLVSGLPWTGFWGAKAQQLATDQGSSLWSTDPGALSDPISRLDESLPHSHARDVPWALGGTAVPDGTGATDGDDEERSVANVDTAVLRADEAGLRHPFTVALPGDGEGVFSVIGYAFDDPTAERTVHVDRYGGDVVSTYGYDDYPLLARVVSQGIGLHEGRSFGTVNFAASALVCLGVVFMCVTGPWMWWRRRPSGSGPTMAAPRGRLPLRSPGLLAALVGLGVLLPLFGITVLVVLAVDQLVIRRIPALEKFFSTT